MKHVWPPTVPLALLGAALWLATSGTLPAAPAGSMASGDYFVQSWQEEEDLPRNTVTGITQTPDGYLWLATYFGLVRFDGVRFQTYGADILPELVKSQLWLLQTDRSGRMWIGTGTGGLIVYDRGRFRLLGTKQGLPHPTVYSLCQDESGVMWVSTGDGSISRVANGTQVERVGWLRGVYSEVAIQLVKQVNGPVWFAQGDSYGHLLNGVATNITRLTGNLVRLCASRDAGMWVAGNRRLQKVVSPGGTSPAVTLALPFGNYQVRTMAEDRQGVLWIGSRESGLFQVRGGELHRIMPTKNPVRDIYEDAEGNIWVSVIGDGLKKVRKRVFQVLDTEGGLPSDQTSTVCEDRDGNMWIGTQIAGLVRRGVDGTVKVMPDATNLIFTSVAPDPHGGVWAGTVVGGLLHHDGEAIQPVQTTSPFRDRQLRVLLNDSQNQLWVGLFPSGLSRHDQGKVIWPAFYRGLGLPNQAIYAMVEDEMRRLWLGLIDGEVLCLKDSQLTAYNNSHGLPGIAIGALHLDSDGTLWVGTLGGGLGSLRNGHFKFASVREGLRDNVIAQIVEDDLGFMWFGSARGIFRVRKQALDQYMEGQRTRFDSIAYGKSDGLVNVECRGGHQPSVWKTRSGELWFTTTKGVIHFDPAALPLNTNPPPLALEQVVVNGKALDLEHPIELAWDHESVEFHYTALSFVSPEKVRFRRQLAGFDREWVEPSANRSALYPRLAPGRYEFRVTACNNDELWAEQPATLALVVHPAWWQMFWVRVAATVLFSGLVGGLVRYYSTVTMRRRLARLEQAHAVEKERTRIARDIHDDVGARLTQMAYLSDLVTSELPEGAHSGRLQDIAQASRQTVRALDEIVWAVNPRKDSLAHLLEYISQYANSVFRNTSVRCRQDLPAAVPDWQLSSEHRHHLFLAAKEALTNIQKHARATEIWIRVSFAAPVLEIVIEDNGAGFSPSEAKPGRDGLHNMRTRLAALQGTCDISSLPGTGTRLVMQVSLPSPTDEGEKL